MRVSAAYFFCRGPLKLGGICPNRRSPGARFGPARASTDVRRPYPCRSTEDVVMRTCDFPRPGPAPGIGHPFINDRQSTTARRSPKGRGGFLAMHQPEPLA
jgi:hypothetical protein